ncbi:hypothetical protein GGR34_003661 [Microvirga flocculans]|uniref:RNA polymerase sigma factor 70 region 1.1 domain-containing protein n=1 Tax=Microvirga flocculans TaxID=217168 RepID=A0A7W6II93_9HYPH|nr:RNA polymerase sigma factor region1.1 domain-containing protein [Microvirga flocculans]MBB4041977.1 hypothetical protein [Microvirga flocculans]
MQQALDSNILDRLIALGREQGRLTNQDLLAHLPVDAMSAEDIALIVIHLEETGIPVDLDDSLIASHAKPRPLPRRSAEIIPFPDRAARMKTRTAPPRDAEPAPSKAPIPGKPESKAVRRAAAAAGLLVLVAMVSLIALFGV